MAGYKIARSIAQNLDLFDKYTCPHCHHLCKDAVQSVCGHWLCESCADELMATSSPKCPRPDCQEDLHSDGDQCFPDRFVRKEIAKMIVLCPYKGNGCQWEDKTATLDAHLKTCTFASDVTCPLASLGCQHNQTVTKQELQKYIAESGPEHLQLIAAILSLLRPLLSPAISSESASTHQSSASRFTRTRCASGSPAQRGQEYTTDLDALLSSNGLTCTDVDGECKDDHILKISLQLEQWELVATRLGLTAAEREAIKGNNQTTEMMRLNCLKKWKSKALLRGTATYRVLLQALLDCGCNDQAKQACSLL